VVGIDASRADTQKTKTNLEWLQKNRQPPMRPSFRVMRGDSTNLDRTGLPQIDGIATEPILLPKYTRNPEPKAAGEVIHDVQEIYERSLRSFSGILERNSRVAIMTPVLIDQTGRSRALDIDHALKDAGFRPYFPQVAQFNAKYPQRVSTTKKKIIQRNLYVATLT
ncbi:MAG: hypothetical protein ACRDF4_01990, partial [Rhabdochlamydiaceae bacterium]